MTIAPRCCANGSRLRASGCVTSSTACVASSAGRLVSAGAAAAAGLTAWGLFESQWLRTRTLEVAVPGLPPALDGLSILHLSDFHAGTPSFNTRSMRKAIDFGVGARPDIVAVTGDIVSHPRAEREVRNQLAGSIRRWASTRSPVTTRSSRPTIPSRAAW